MKIVNIKLDLRCELLFVFRIMLLNIPAIVLCNILACMTGLAVFAFFAKSGCDPLANHDVQNPNQVYINHLSKPNAL